MSQTDRRRYMGEGYSGPFKVTYSEVGILYDGRRNLDTGTNDNTYTLIRGNDLSDITEYDSEGNLMVLNIPSTFRMGTSFKQYVEPEVMRIGDMLYFLCHEVYDSENNTYIVRVNTVTLEHSYKHLNLSDLYSYAVQFLDFSVFKDRFLILVVMSSSGAYHTFRSSDGGDSWTSFKWMGSGSSDYNRFIRVIKDSSGVYHVSYISDYNYASISSYASYDDLENSDWFGNSGWDRPEANIRPTKPTLSTDPNPYGVRPIIHGYINETGVVVHGASGSAYYTTTSLNTSSNYVFNDLSLTYDYEEDTFNSVVYSNTTNLMYPISGNIRQYINDNNETRYTGQGLLGSKYPLTKPFTDAENYFRVGMIRKGRYFIVTWRSYENIFSYDGVIKDRIDIYKIDYLSLGNVYGYTSDDPIYNTSISDVYISRFSRNYTSDNSNELPRFYLALARD